MIVGLLPLLVDINYFSVIWVFRTKSCSSPVTLCEFRGISLPLHDLCIQLFQLRLSRRQGKRSNMNAKGLSGKTSFIPEYNIIHRFSTKFKIRSCFLMNINRDHVSLETKYCSVGVFLIVTPSKPFVLVFDFSALLGDNLN